MLTRQVIAGGCALLMTISIAVLGREFWQQRDLELFSQAVAVDGSGNVVEVEDPAQLVPGARVVAGGAHSARERADQLRWLRSGTVPRTPDGTSPTLVTDALLDLHVLSETNGVAVAGWTPQWRYVWPRDSAFVLSALARTGHLADADRLLDFLQSVQSPDGTFQARYLPDGSGVPDDRGTQLDGSGWALWGLGQVREQSDAAQRQALVHEYEPLLTRSVDAIRAAVDTPTGLARVSTDYWELPEASTTLATSSVLLAGLESAVPLFQDLGRTDEAGAAQQAAAHLESAIVTHFEPDGYPRHPGGRPSSIDLGAAFLLPPFGHLQRPELVRAWRGSEQYLRRPGGGLANGGSWRNDGISWTPTISSYAVVAACVDPAWSHHWLSWLDQHRTAAGALPEKVRPDGSPAYVAPLAWTSAAVVIAADLLDEGC